MKFNKAINLTAFRYASGGKLWQRYDSVWGQPMKLNKSLWFVIAIAVSGCAGNMALIGTTQPIKFQETKPVTKDSYAKNKTANGVVLLDINWGRWWGCGGHENAQLIGLAFDKLPMPNTDNDAEPSLVIKSPSRLMVDPVFLNYAYSLEPGEYAISALSIKVADSGPKVGFLTAQRNDLYKDGRPIGGSFVVNPKETVFVGNFYLDCAYGPTLWRYHPDGKDAFEKQMVEYKNSFPFLDLDNVKFRLFKTKEFGYDYELAR
jgi:hypothetical protein